MLEWYPSTRAPTSMITVSPARRRRRLTSWCGQGGVIGAGGDDRVVAAVIGTVAPHAVLEFVAEVGFGHGTIDGSEQHGFHLGECHVRLPPRRPACARSPQRP